MNRIACTIIVACAACQREQPRQPIIIYQPPAETRSTRPPEPVVIPPGSDKPAAAEPKPAEGVTLPAVPPGTYVSHIGDPKAGQWGPDGQWRWNDPESTEAKSTLSYLAAAGVGAAGGAALTYLMTRRNFEQAHPTGWNAADNQRTITTFVDHNGSSISEAEYLRRREQSERDRQRYWETQKQQVAKERAEVAKQRQEVEHERAQMQAKRRDHNYVAPKPVPSPPPRKKLSINRWVSRRK